MMSLQKDQESVPQPAAVQLAVDNEASHVRFRGTNITWDIIRLLSLSLQFGTKS